MTAPIIWRALLVAVAGDLLIPFALGLAWPGYSHRRQVMSELGAKSAPTGVWYSRWLVLAGLLLMLGSLGVFRLYSGGPALLRGLLIALTWAFALGACVLCGLFPVNLQNGEQSLAHRVHGGGAALGFMALAFLPLVISRLAAHSGDELTAALSLTAFILDLICFTLFVLSEREGLPSWLSGSTGLFQRLALLFMYLPLLWLGLTQSLGT